MELEVGASIEVVIQSDSGERDFLTGTFTGWQIFGDINYLALASEGARMSYISEMTIKVIHVY